MTPRSIQIIHMGSINQLRRKETERRIFYQPIINKLLRWEILVEPTW